MTVAELIEVLETLPPDAKVVMPHCYDVALDVFDDIDLEDIHLVSSNQVQIG